MNHRRILEQSGRSFAYAVSAVSIACAAPSVTADWPTEPASPLVLGGVQGIGAIDHVLTTTPDGATWVAWVDMQCMGDLRVQRISDGGSLLIPGGLAVDHDPGCVGTDAFLAASSSDSVLVTRSQGPVYRVGADGAALWDPPLELAGGTFGRFLSLSDGDVLITWHLGSSIFVHRYAADGKPVWSEPATFNSVSGSNMRIFSLVNDGSDGAFVFWDSPGKYTRHVRVTRVSVAGEVLWDEPLRVVPFPPGSSRHTDPVAIEDGGGGALLVWTVGAESAHTIVPLLMQRITADGLTMFEPEGHRISLDFTRQFDALVMRDDASSDFFIAWRDGVFEQALKVQRVSPLGERLWGDGGLALAPIASGLASHFDGTWDGEALKLVLADETADPAASTVSVHHVDGTGAIAMTPWSISGSDPAGAVHGVLLKDALAVTWFHDEPSFEDLLVAQRVNDDGSLGLPSLAGDLDGDAVVGFTDLVTLLASWGPCPAPCAADLDADGAVGFADLLVLLANWS